MISAESRPLPQNTVHPRGPLDLADVPKPEPGPDQVLVEVHRGRVEPNRPPGFASPLRRSSACSGGLRRPKLSILGTEVSGVVVAVGRDVTKFTVGDRVFGVHADRFGTHAEYVCIKESAPLARMPDNMSFIEGAGVCDGMILGINCIRRFDLGPPVTES